MLEFVGQSGARVVIDDDWSQKQNKSKEGMKGGRHERLNEVMNKRRTERTKLQRNE